MGTVYLAVDQQLKRTVALKVLPKDKADNKTLVRRFKAEGQAGAQLEHPNIVSVYESGEIDGYLYLAMEYIEGLDAYELLKKRASCRPSGLWRSSSKSSRPSTMRISVRWSIATSSPRIF